MVADVRHMSSRRVRRRLVASAIVVGLAGVVWDDGGPRALVSASQQPAPPAPQRVAGAPDGEVTKGEFDQSKVYPGTWREYWVYVPKQLDRAKPAPVMVFQDGLQYNAPIVFDNLIHAKTIPPMVGVFVMHGRVRAPSADALDRMNRSYEYDSVSGDYARFLLDELLPHIAKTHSINLSIGSERSRHRRQQQRCDRSVRRGLAAP